MKVREKFGVGAFIKHGGRRFEMSALIPLWLNRCLQKAVCEKAKGRRLRRHSEPRTRRPVALSALVQRKRAIGACLPPLAVFTNVYQREDNVFDILCTKSY